MVVAVGIAVAAFALPASPAAASSHTVDQCNGHGPGPQGATTGMTCEVTVVNTIERGATSSTVTVTRQCSLAPCAPGNGTFTTSSTSLITDIDQCNNSDNDSAHPVTCTVRITNNISNDTAGAQPLTAATVNQCVGSGGGGGGTVNCDPFPATTTDATVTQCNGSANGGGGTVDCAVAASSLVSPVIPIKVRQCNGTGNPGGSVVTCRTTITTNLRAAAPAPTASATTAPTAAPTATSVPVALPPQVTRIPRGGVDTGAGPADRAASGWLFGLGGLVLLGATATFLIARRSDGSDLRSG